MFSHDHPISLSSYSYDNKWENRIFIIIIIFIKIVIIICNVFAFSRATLWPRTKNQVRPFFWRHSSSPPSWWCWKLWWCRWWWWSNSLRIQSYSPCIVLLASPYSLEKSSDFSDAASFNEYGSESVNDALSDGNSEHNSSADEDSQLRCHHHHFNHHHLHHFHNHHHQHHH